MPVYPVKDKGCWRFEFNRVIKAPDGTKSRVRATKLLPKAWGRTEAEKYDRDETARLYAVATGAQRPEPLIDEAVKLYLDKCAPKHRDKGKKAAQDLAHLYPYFHRRPVSQFAAVASAYSDDHHDLADGTRHNRLATLKAAGRYAWKRHKLTDHDPTAHMEIPRPNNVREIQLPVERVWKLLDAIRAIDVESCALFTLAFRVGSRWIKGVHPRQPEDILRNGRDVWLRVGVTKNGTPRMKWVHPDARWALGHIPFTHAPNYYYRRYRKALQVSGLAELPGLKRFRPHDMRHVIGTDIRMRGGSLEDVGAALDHISYAASQRYAEIVPAQVKRVLAGVGGASKKVHTARRRRALKKAA